MVCPSVIGMPGRRLSGPKESGNQGTDKARLRIPFSSQCHASFSLPRARCPAAVHRALPLSLLFISLSHHIRAIGCKRLFPLRRQILRRQMPSVVFRPLRDSPHAPLHPSPLGSLRPFRIRDPYLYSLCCGVVKYHTRNHISLALLS